MVNLNNEVKSDEVKIGLQGNKPKIEIVQEIENNSKNTQNSEEEKQIINSDDLPNDVFKIDVNVLNDDFSVNESNELKQNVNNSKNNNNKTITFNNNEKNSSSLNIILNEVGKFIYGKDYVNFLTFRNLEDLEDEFVELKDSINLSLRIIKNILKTEQKQPFEKQKFPLGTVSFYNGISFKVYNIRESFKRIYNLKKAYIDKYYKIRDMCFKNNSRENKIVYVLFKEFFVNKLKKESKKLENMLYFIKIVRRNNLNDINREETYTQLVYDLLGDIEEIYSEKDLYKRKIFK